MTKEANVVVEIVVQRCSTKKVFLEIFQNSQENSYAKVSFLIKLQAWGTQIFKKIDTGTGAFLWILRNCKIPLVAGSKDVMIHREIKIAAPVLQLWRQLVITKKNGKNFSSWLFVDILLGLFVSASCFCKCWQFFYDFFNNLTNPIQ